MPVRCASNAAATEMAKSLAGLALAPTFKLTTMSLIIAACPPELLFVAMKYSLQGKLKCATPRELGQCGDCCILCRGGVVAEFDNIAAVSDGVEVDFIDDP